LNWAAIHELPVLFVCEDNRWSATTATDAMTAGEGALARAQAIGVAGEKVDGNDVFAVDAAAARLAAQIRAGGGPRLLHAITYRVKGHVSVDLATYRNGEEVDRAIADDPIPACLERLAALGATREAIEAIERAARDEVAAAVRAAAAAPWPQVEAAYSEIQDTGSGRWE
jgi:pyruvate dehydrogenase E1 component alpha subunit